MTNTQSPQNRSDQTIAQAAAPGSRRKRTLLIGTAVGVLLLGGGTAFAIGSGPAERDAAPVEVPAEGPSDGTGAADGRDDADVNDVDDVNDDADDSAAEKAEEKAEDEAEAAGKPEPADKDDADDTNDADDADDRAEDQAAGSTAPVPASDAASLRDAADTALAETGGEGVTSLGVDPGFYEIEVLMADGSEADVRIAADGTVTTSTEKADADDTTAEPILELEELPAIETAALGAEGAGDGTIEEISASDDRGTAVEVGIRLPSGGEMDVDLAKDLGVVATETEQD